MNTILEARDLCKTFSNATVQQHVLRNLNLTIEEGDYTVIMGTTIFLATLMVTMTLITDIVYKLIDPRITLE